VCLLVKALTERRMTVPELIGACLEREPRKMCSAIQSPAAANSSSRVEKYR
jgi:hypothetical protein